MRTRAAVATLSIAAVAALPAAANAERDRTEFVRADRSKPITLERGKVIGQAATTTNGRLVVRLAVRKRGETRVLARTHHKIESAVSRPTKARLKITLTRRRRGTVAVLGPLNDVQPDAILYRLRWRLGRNPAVRIVSAGV